MLLLRSWCGDYTKWLYYTTISFKKLCLPTEIWRAKYSCQRHLRCAHWYLSGLSHQNSSFPDSKNLYLIKVSFDGDDMPIMRAHSSIVILRKKRPHELEYFEIVFYEREPVLSVSFMSTISRHISLFLQITGSSADNILIAIEARRLPRRCKRFIKSNFLTLADIPYYSWHF